MKIPDGVGYGIRKKYIFAKISNKDIYEIISNISESYKLNETSIRNRLQELGIEPRNLLKLDFVSAIRAGVRNNVMGDARIRGQRNQNDSDASDIVIRNDKGESNEYDEVDHTRIKAPLSQITNHR